ncbi:SDR family NAD(P)-dependent oxidoreductase [Streptomyces sp. NPDC050560]|uniref:SDR family NAD(P)-dependent oxidoreductase n=1 Tax=Streptomyces sp. NPDC050560 TaxID=3365630 RepID=UPI0037AF6401
MGRLDHTVALITGGTRGLGRAIAESYLAEGATVMCAARGPHDIGELTDEHPGRLAYRRADITDEDDVRRLVAATVDTFGSLDVLVSNAGVSRDGKIAGLSLDDWHSTVSTNLTGTFLCTRAAIGPMTAQGGGRIVNVSSCLATRTAAGAAAYSASKAAVEMFSRTSAVELAPRGITVNCLAPGYIDEGMGRQVAATPRAWDTYRRRLLAGRLGTPAELGAAAVFLACADSAYVNGHVLEVNGGLLWAA